MGIMSLFKRSNAIYFPDSITYFKFPEYFELYKKIFNRLKIDFVLIDKHIDCGLDPLEAGYENEARKLARMNFDMLKEAKISRIITNSPSCYKMFTQNYSGLLPDWNIETLNMWEIISSKLSSNSNYIKDKSNEQVTFHDSCYLGRYCGIYDAPREIIKLFGYEIKEMNDNRERSICCGSCGGLPRTNPELSDKIAKERLLQAKRTGAKKLVVCSLDNYYLLNKNSKGLGIEVVELSEIIARGLGISIDFKDLLQGKEAEENKNKEIAVNTQEENMKEDVDENQEIT